MLKVVTEKIVFVVRFFHSFCSHFNRLIKAEDALFVSNEKQFIFSRMHATLQPALSVGRSVGRSHFTFFYDFISLTSLPKWSGDLKYGPCPPAPHFGSRVEA